MSEESERRHRIPRTDEDEESEERASVAKKPSREVEADYDLLLAKPKPKSTGPDQAIITIWK